MKSGEAPKIQMPSTTRELIQRPAAPDEKKKKAADAKAKKRTRRGRFPVYFWAMALTFLWVGSFAAFGYGAYGPHPEVLLSFDVGALAALAAVILLPVGFIWVGAAAFLRLIDLSDASLKLATISRELIDPNTTAANDVAKLGATIRKELESLNREVDGAVSRVGLLEQRLREQTQLISETSARVGTQTTEIADRLAEEHERVEAITKALAEESRAISETFDAQSLAIDASAEAAVKSLHDAEQALAGRTEALGKTADNAAQATKSIAEDIERETGRLESVAANARSRSEAITARFAEQHKMMVEAVERQAEQQSRIDAAMDQHQRLISKATEVVAEQITKMSESVTHQTARVADRVAQQITAIETTVGAQTGKISSEVGGQVEAVEAALDGLNAKLGGLAEDHLKAIEAAVTAHTGELAGKLSAEAGEIEELLDKAKQHFTETVDGARKDALAAGEGFAGQAAAMREAADGAAGKLAEAVETIKGLAAQTRKELEGQVKSADSLFHEQAHNARTLLRQHADEMGAALEASINDVRERLTSFAEEGNDALLERAGELDEALRRSEQRMRALYNRLDESIEGLTLGTDSVAKRFADTADAFEARMAQFPAHAEDAANQVHEHINAQIAHLARIADNAAERAQVLIETDAGEPALQLEADAAPEQNADAEPGAPAPEEAATSKEPDLPGRDDYPEIWDSMDRSGPRRPRIGRPALGPFDDLAKSLADRFRGSASGEKGTMGKTAASATGVLKQKEEDISDFRIVRRDENKEKNSPAASARPSATPPRNETPKSGVPKFEDRGWKDILAAVDRQEEERKSSFRRTMGDGDDASFQRDALLIIEKLQAMSIDLDRALEDTPPAELLDRYMSGERNVFARRLATFTTPEMLEKIARTHRENSEFRRDVTRYIDSFEDLLKAARGRDRENILLETYLTSQTGKVYMILGTAIGHLKQRDL